MTDIPGDEKDKTIRERSGEFNSPDPLTAFFYLLLKKYPPGDIEGLIQDICKQSTSTVYNFSNGWLATYAQDLAFRIYQAGGGDGIIKPRLF